MGSEGEEGGIWGELSLGVLGKEAWSLVAMVTKTEQVGGDRLSTGQTEMLCLEVSDEL